MSSERAATAAHQPSWEQGSMLPDGVGVLPLQWVHPAEPATRAARGAVTTATRERGTLAAPFPVPTPAKQGDRMVVITQTCDLIKPAHELPQIEVARAFATTTPRVIAQAQDFGSARFFRLNGSAQEQAVVLDYGQRALLDKGFLNAVKPDNALPDAWSDDERKTLARWLGQRYSRPAIPDEDYNEITRPVRDAWKRLVEEDPKTAASFNREYAEWRYRREEDGSLTIYVLSPRPDPDELIGLEVIDFLTQAIEPGYPARVRVASDHRSYHTFTKADELSTEQISMEWASHDEGLEDAALPS